MTVLRPDTKRPSFAALGTLHPYVGQDGNIIRVPAPAGGASIPPYVPVSPSLLSLNHFDAADGSSITNDELGSEVWRWASFSTGVEIDTAQSRFGGSSLMITRFGGAAINRYYNAINQNDFTYEFWMRRPAGCEVMFRLEDDGGGVGVAVRVTTGGTVFDVWDEQGTNYSGFTPSNLCPVDTFTHFMVQRDDRDVHVCAGGTKYGTITLPAGKNPRNFTRVNIFDWAPAAGNFWIDEYRASAGKRYVIASNAYTVPTSPFTV